MILDGVHFRCEKLDLGQHKTDLDETLGMYRVHSETMQCHIFHFRSRPGNRKLEISENPTITPCKIFLEIPDFLDTEIFPN